MPLTRGEYLFVKLSEECDEVGQRASKTIIFGAEEQQPGQPYNNARRVLAEFHDLLGVIEMLTEEGFLPVASDEERDAAIAAKKEKVENYFNFSANRGIIEGIKAAPHAPHPEAPYGMCSKCHRPLPEHKLCLSCIRAEPAGPGE